MPTLLPWTTTELGDIDLFSPTLPSLVVYTWYVDDEPESSVVHFWRDEDTGTVQSELLFVGPLTFDAAVAHAKEKAPERNVDRIHIKHARPAAKAKPVARPKPAPRSVATAKQARKAVAKPRAQATAPRSKRKAPARKASR